MQEIKNCRLCKGDFEALGTLGEQYINNFPDKWPYTGSKCPLDLVKCKSCTLVQLKHTAPQELLYSGHYWYKSNINKVIVEDLLDIAKLSMGYMGKGDTIIDVGANDGTLLKFIGKDYHRIGVEPATNLFEELKSNCDIAVCDFWEDLEFKRAKVITALGMFYDSENPNLFMKSVKRNLKTNGIFIAQLMTLKPMIEKSDVGNICHEHLEYYSYKSLVTLYERNGLEIFKVEENSINGGSYRLFARHFNEGSVKHPEPEVDWKKFFNNLEKNKKKTVDFIRDRVNFKDKVYAYGASTKGNCILQYYGLGSDDIVAVADKNPEKWGKFTLTGIPIVSEEEARKHADWFFILPYAFTDFFVEREKEWHKGDKRFIVSIPKFRII